MNEKHLVTQSNKLINSHYDLSLAEQKIILTLISLVQPTDQDFEPYEFKIAEFMKLLAVDTKTKYTEVPKITKALMQKVFEIKEGKRTLQIAWICSALHDDGTGTVTLKFAPELKPYLLELKGLFTSFPLEHILKLTSKYSIRLYEILKSYEYQHTVKIDLSELTNILKLSKSYSDFGQIKRRILEPSQKEMAEKTDIQFDYEFIKTGKKVTALKFTIKSNKKNKPESILLEPQKQLPPSENIPAIQADIEAIKAEFRQRYKAELVDHFVAEMITKKGLTHVQECLRTYGDYIKGKKVTNVGGFFTSFVLNDYVKPVSLDATPRQYPIFEISPEERERQEKIARGEPVAPIANPEIAQASLKSMKEILGMRQK